MGFTLKHRVKAKSLHSLTQGHSHELHCLTQTLTQELSLSLCVCVSVTLKGSLTRDFRLQVFFVNQCPPGP
jgi:hypothetical protein